MIPVTTGPRVAQGWQAVLGKALCWGAPFLILGVLLTTRTGTLAGTAGAILPVLAALACPFGMFFMMRWPKGGRHASSDGNGAR